MNEYEYYPDGDWRYNPIADWWAMRMARWVKGVAPHGHVVSVHNGPRLPPFAQRFALDPDAIDAVMFQSWGTRDEELGWLAAGIEEDVWAAFEGWQGSAIMSEYGYERNPDLPLKLPSHEFCDVEHTRRGAWRGAFCALHVIHGFENSWGPFMVLDEDQPGLDCLLHLERFFRRVVPFDRLRSAPELMLPGEYVRGGHPLALATAEQDVVCAYLPVGGAVTLDLPADAAYEGQWFDPRTGELLPVERAADEAFCWAAPGGTDEKGHPWDWVLVLRQV
jgi:hypothetical protein